MLATVLTFDNDAREVHFGLVHLGVDDADDAQIRLVRACVDHHFAAR